MGAAQFAADLEQQRGLADAGRAANQNQRTADAAASQNPIQLSHAGRKTDFIAPLDFRETFRPHMGAARTPGCGDRTGGLHVFLECIPCAAGAAAALPLGCFIAAFRTVIGHFRFHWCPPFLCTRSRCRPGRWKAVSGTQPYRALRTPPHWREIRTQPECRYRKYSSSDRPSPPV